MFGQIPQLPVDFLLGKVEEAAAETLHAWVREHQTRLRSWRKQLNNLRVRDAPLGQLGQLVYLSDVGVRGWAKIRDRWSPVVYQVVKAPKEEGSVYSIAPVDDLDKVKQVHRSLLKG